MSNSKKAGAFWVHVYVVGAAVCTVGVAIGWAYEPSACGPLLIGVVCYSALAMIYGIYGNRAE